LAKTNKYLEEELQYFDTKLAQDFYSLIQSYNKFVKERAGCMMDTLKDSDRSIQSMTVSTGQTTEINENKTEIKL